MFGVQLLLDLARRYWKEARPNHRRLQDLVFVANFRPFDVTNTKIELIWDVLANAASYKVQYLIDYSRRRLVSGRKHDRQRGNRRTSGPNALRPAHRRGSFASTGATPSFGRWATTAVATTTGAMHSNCG